MELNMIAPWFCQSGHPWPLCKAGMRTLILVREEATPSRKKTMASPYSPQAILAPKRTDIPECNVRKEVKHPTGLANAVFLWKYYGLLREMRSAVDESIHIMSYIRVDSDFAMISINFGTADPKKGD
jgi:hypothetical protein